MNRFREELKQNGIEPNEYLIECKKNALKHGYNPNMLSFADDNKHKLKYEKADGQFVTFGAAAYRDHIMYKFLEKINLYPRGYADSRQRLYRKRASHIKGDWAKDKYSANSLAINILW
jgi:hypothetical protein